MPNQENFRSDITTTTDIRFNASRVVRFPQEGILTQEVPASFGFSDNDNIELHFYTIPGNQLALSLIIDLQDRIAKSHIVSYSDGTNKNYIRIDFSEIFNNKKLILVPGDYRMVMNFFSSEIGNYTDRKLSLSTISPTRTEVELTFNDSINEVTIDQNQNLVYEFVETSLEKPYAAGAADKIFKSGVQMQDSTEGLTAVNVLKPADVSLLTNLGILQEFRNELNNFLLELGDFIKEDLIINGDQLIQQPQFQEIIRNMVEEKIVLMQIKFNSKVKIN